MRAFHCWMVVLMLGACTPFRPPVVPSPVRPAAARPAPVEVPAQAPPRPATPLCAPQLTQTDRDGIRFDGVAFDSRSHRLIVADQPNGPGSRWADAEAARVAHSGLAAINAGFFTPEGDPLGKVVSGGAGAGGWNRSSSLGSGVWLEAGDGSVAIRRREVVASGSGARELLQAGPLLVESHVAVGGLEASKTSIRSVVLWDGGTRWWIGQASACTLAELGRALATCAPAGWQVAHALNLDGGRSADLAVSGGLAGGPVVRRAIWNRPVRNFLVLVPR